MFSKQYKKNFKKLNLKLVNFQIIVFIFYVFGSNFLEQFSKKVTCRICRLLFFVDNDKGIEFIMYFFFFLIIISFKFEVGILFVS